MTAVMESPTAACTAPGVNPDIFTAKGPGNVKAAKAICATCPLIEACLKDALEQGERGIWGGTTEAERLGLTSGKRGPRRKPINHGSIGGYKTHRKRGEVACPECKDAINAYQKRLRMARPPKPQEETT